MFHKKDFKALKTLTDISIVSSRDQYNLELAGTIRESGLLFGDSKIQIIIEEQVIILFTAVCEFLHFFKLHDLMFAKVFSDSVCEVNHEQHFAIVAVFVIFLLIYECMLEDTLYNTTITHTVCTLLQH